MKPMTSEEIFDLAEKIYKNEVFTDRHLQRPDDAQMVFMVFMFMDNAEEALKDVGMIWEDMSKAAPMGVNGMPIFFSANLVSKADAEKVWTRYKRIKETLDVQRKFGG